jgi:cytoskeletal protein CcmA (bactofilin family)
MTWFDRNPGDKKGPEKDGPVEQHSPVEKHGPVIEEPMPDVEPEKLPASPPAPVPTATRPAEPVLVASLYHGSKVSGQLTFQGPARIDGSVEGEVHCNGKLIIGEGAEVRAKVSGQTLIIQGRVEGNITAKERIELQAPARLYGNIETPRLVIAEGVVFDGDCSMGLAKQKVAVASAQGASAEKAATVKAPKLEADSD